MKEIGNEILFTKEEKKKIIFKVLGKKRQLDYNPKDYYQSLKKKKNIFILQKPSNNININILNNYTEKQNFNENNINTNNNIIEKKQTKNIVNVTLVTTPQTAELSNPIKINVIKNSDLNKINNIIIKNNNINKEIKNNNNNNNNNNSN